MKIVPATLELLREYYGDLAIPTMRAYVLLDEDIPVAVAGFIRAKNGKMLVISEARDWVYTDHKLTVMKFAKMMVRIADEKGWILMADPSPDLPTSKKFILHFGFEINENGEYIRWPV